MTETKRCPDCWPPGQAYTGDITVKAPCKACTGTGQVKPAGEELSQGGDDQDSGEMQPNWETPCDNCEQLPTVDDLGLCGPCCFGEADAIDWYDQ